MSKKLYLIALDPEKAVILFARELRSGGMPQLKYYADNILRELDPAFREGRVFTVVVSEDEIKAGDPFDRDKTQICFHLL